jgi:hypothetical protein
MSTMTDVSEQWRPVVGFEEFYEVSDHGRVRSRDRVVIIRNAHARKVPAHILPLTPNGKSGRVRVNLCHHGLEAGRDVHLLILEAFRGPRPEGAKARYLNGQSGDNRLDNLIWEIK